MRVCEKRKRECVKRECVCEERERERGSASNSPNELAIGKDVECIRPTKKKGWIESRLSGRTHCEAKKGGNGCVILSLLY